MTKTTYVCDFCGKRIKKENHRRLVFRVEGCEQFHMDEMGLDFCEICYDRMCKHYRTFVEESKKGRKK